VAFKWVGAVTLVPAQGSQLVLQLNQPFS
jgi:hypothetical protein